MVQAAYLSLALSPGDHAVQPISGVMSSNYEPEDPYMDIKGTKPKRAYTSPS